MERKIGEIFEYNGEWYQTVKSKGKCCSCDFMIDGHCIVDFSSNGSCFYCHRKDKENVIFKKLEKVGEPYMLKDKKFQKYRVFKTPYIYNKIDWSRQSFADPYYVSLEIKQNKEDMEENKLNLKPFDLQKAKDGKPVCTRDGRRARIICFDAKFPKTGNIVTLVEKENGEEVTLFHYDDGHCSIGRGYDLMMLPEKREGWVNVYYDRIDGITFSKHPYPSKEEAIKNVGTMSNRIDTVKISWEE